MPGKILGDPEFIETKDGFVKLQIKKGCREHCVFFGEYLMANFDQVSKNAPGYFGRIFSMNELITAMVHYGLIGE